LVQLIYTSVVGVKLLRLVNLIQQYQGVDMSIGQIKIRRPWRRILGSFGLLLITGLFFQCGKDEKKSDAPPANTSPEIPTDWDGKSDWQGSSWKVTTE